MTDLTTASMALCEDTDTELAEAELAGCDSGGGFNTKDGGGTEAEPDTAEFWLIDDCGCEFPDCAAAEAEVNEATDWDTAGLGTDEADAAAAAAAAEA